MSDHNAARIAHLANRIELELTCGACPEQYDATLDGRAVGYLRLRHGVFRVECGGNTVLEAGTAGDGMFEPQEREDWLSKAKMAIAAYTLLYGEGIPE